MSVAKANLWLPEVIGAAIEVHRELGPGYHEPVYEEAMSLELRSRDIPHERQLVVPIIYKGAKVGKGRMDFVVDRCLIVELKAVEALTPLHTAQVLSYLKASHVQLGLLINFNQVLLKQGLRRIILT